MIYRPSLRPFTYIQFCTCPKGVYSFSILNALWNSVCHDQDFYQAFLLSFLKIVKYMIYLFYIIRKIKDMGPSLFLFGFSLGGHRGGAQGIPLVQHSEITSGGAYQTTWDPQDRICIICMPGKNLTYYYIYVAHALSFRFL